MLGLKNLSREGYHHHCSIANLLLLLRASLACKPEQFVEEFLLDSDAL